jgi:hypothetical protein
MAATRTKCRHRNATFYGVQKLGSMPGIVLYNCPDCKTTLSEETLFALRDAETNVEPKQAVA